MSVIALLLVCFILLSVLLGYYLLLKVLGRQKNDMDYNNLTPKQQEWVNKFGDLNDKAAKLYAECPPEKWYRKSFDGLKLAAEFYPAGDSHRYAICIHGYTSCGIGMRKFAAIFHEWGFNVLVPDNRAHGDSEGKWIGMGYLDGRDLQGWVNLVVEKDSDAQIFLMGQSMGAATVMMASGLDLPENVRFLVEDCGYTSAWDEFAYKLKGMHVPLYLLYICSFLSKIIVGYSFKEASAVDALKRNERPILFVHGMKDKFVPYWMLDQLVAANPGYKEVLCVEEAGHSLSPAYAKEVYFQRIKQFSEEFMD